MDFGLEGRVALVTGASRGLGAEMAAGLAAEGCRVVVAARSENDLQAVAQRHPDLISPIRADMLDTPSLGPLVDTVVEREGRIDVLVNNAGIAPAGDFLTQDPVVWERTLTVNVLAPMALAQAAGRHFVSQGSGKIINVASTAGVRGKAPLAGYAASKGALLRLTESLAAEWARHGIQVNAIAPGAFATEAQHEVLDSEDLLHRRIRRIPLRRMGEPAEIVGLTCLLASRHSDFITGSTFVIDGGEAGKL